MAQENTAITLEQLQTFHNEVVKALQSLSPSAPYALRNTAEEKTPPGYIGEWWKDYPEGCSAAFIARVAKALRRLPLHSEDPLAYPPPKGWVYVWRPWDDLPDPTGFCPS